MPATQTELGCSQWQWIQTKQLYCMCLPKLRTKQWKVQSVNIAALTTCLNRDSQSSASGGKILVTPGDNIKDVELPRVSPAAIQIK